jgi:hypothetical protein
MQVLRVEALTQVAHFLRKGGIAGFHVSLPALRQSVLLLFVRQGQLNAFKLKQSSYRMIPSELDRGPKP